MIEETKKQPGRMRRPLVRRRRCLQPRRGSTPVPGRIPRPGRRDGRSGMPGTLGMLGIPKMPCRFGRAPRRLLGAALLLLALLAPLARRAGGQLGVDTALIMAALSRMQSLMTSYVALPLRTISQAEQSLASYQQQVLYPAGAIGRARAWAVESESRFGQVAGLYGTPVASATLPQSAALESVLLSRNAAAMPEVPGRFQGVYGAVMAPGAASGAVRAMTDMTDAEAQDAMKRAIEIDALADAELAQAGRIGQEIAAAAPGSAPILEAETDAWVVRANACTQAALAELLRARAIDLANRSRLAKLAAIDNGRVSGLIGPPAQR